MSPQTSLSFCTASDLALSMISKIMIDTHHSSGLTYLNSSLKERRSDRSAHKFFERPQRMVIDMEDIKEQLGQIRTQIHHFQETIEQLTPRRGQLKWLGPKAHRSQLQLLFKGSEDVLNHAATLRGYFDGVSARGDFQRYAAAHLPAPHYGKLTELMTYLSNVLNAVDAVFEDLCQREPLTMKANGPKKPGPARTLEVCAAHLKNLQMRVCLVIQGLASSQELQERASAYLDQD